MIINILDVFRGSRVAIEVAIDESITLATENSWVRHLEKHDAAISILTDLLDAASACINHGGGEVVTAGAAMARVERLRTILAKATGETP